MPYFIIRALCLCVARDFHSIIAHRPASSGASESSSCVCLCSSWVGGSVILFIHIVSRATNLFFFNLGPISVSVGENRGVWGLFTTLYSVSQALQDILSKFVYCRNHIFYENFKLKLCTCAQSPRFGHTYKVSAWNSHHKCDFRHGLFSRYYFGELAKR